MPTDPMPYVQVKPGDLITADLFNTVQADIKTDIAQQIATSIGGITTVKHADDADALAGSTIDQLTAAILDKLKALIPGRTGYMQTFNRLELNREKVIKHGLAAMPVVDVYQMEYFPVVQVDDANAPHDYTELYVNFYLYHESEQSFRLRGLPPVVIEDLDRTPFRLLLKDVLALYNVDTSKETMTLDELETNLWDALFASPSDRFGTDQYARSPWWEKCCGEKRTIKDLKDDGHWDKLRLKLMPRKTINWENPPVEPQPLPPGSSPLYGPGGVPPSPGAPPPPPTVAPTQIQVVHFDLNTIGITLLDYPVYPVYPPAPNAGSGANAVPPAINPDNRAPNDMLPPGYERELKVMVVLKA